FANFEGILEDGYTVPNSPLSRKQGLVDPSQAWDDVSWLRSITKLPVILKGITTGDDAEKAISHGVSAIIVSNHGGWLLDGVAATIEILPEIVSAVRGRVEVYMDGGVRRGTDVVKALALGAKAVFVGRPTVWGLAYNVRQPPTD
ncbi:(S)-2-hydroxy-acid oxidase, putative, partial [Ixodes scapularis]